MKQSGLMQRQQEREDAALMAGIRIGVQYAIDTLNISLSEAGGWGYDHADPRKWMNYGGHIFCGYCGAPMTDEAVEIRLKELEALKDGL